jgi:GNAT superfamily N-acetyltransferase
MIREATREDVELLIDLRLAFIREDDAPLDDHWAGVLRKQMESFFPEHIGKDFFAFLMEEEGGAVSSVFLREEHTPANKRFPTGVTGTIYNVYTLPEWRRRGYATALVKEAMGKGKERNYSFIALQASEKGYPLYKSLGFRETHSPYVPMEYRFHSEDGWTVP